MATICLGTVCTNTQFPSRWAPCMCGLLGTLLVVHRNRVLLYRTQPHCHAAPHHGSSAAEVNTIHCPSLVPNTGQGLFLSVTVLHCIKLSTMAIENDHHNRENDIRVRIYDNSDGNPLSNIMMCL